MNVDKRFKDKLYKNEDPIQAIKTYEGILENYLLIHTVGTIGVFKHRNNKRHNKDVMIWNVLKPWQDGHTHLHKKETAVQIANNIYMQKRPKSRERWILISHLRVATDNYNYFNLIDDLLEIKLDKKIGNNNYHNVNKGKAS